jgi:TRAP-type mannitol/chloroaromatic compound transport system permease large subunit
MSSQIREKISYSQVMPALVLISVVLGIMVFGIHKKGAA